MKVIEVLADSPLFGHVRQGDRLIRINGEEVSDRLDCQYKLSEASVALEFRSTTGKVKELLLDNDYNTDLGIRFDKDRIKACRNKCIFCFVHQQPKGMRYPLYFRDDDFRLSFTHGNFITLSNLEEEDYKRIGRQRLSPLYVSVHTTDNVLRRKMFGNKRLPDIMMQLKRLGKTGAVIHTQIVLCPGINDGQKLAQCINDLYSLFPNVATIGVVPVGLTRYRKGLPGLMPFDKAGAVEVLKVIKNFQRKFLKENGSRFVYAADEFYLLADRKFPRLIEYEDMPQFENGIGMMRLMLTDFARRKRHLRNCKSKARVAILSGELASGSIGDEIVPFLKEEKRFNINIIPVKNDFWGHSVSVSGLLTGQDLLKSAQMNHKKYDIFLLPPNCLNDDNLFLDDLGFKSFTSRVEADVHVGSYSFIDTLRELDL